MLGVFEERKLSLSCCPLQLDATLENVDETLSGAATNNADKLRAELYAVKVTVANGVVSWKLQTGVHFPLRGWGEEVVTCTHFDCALQLVKSENRRDFGGTCDLMFEARFSPTDGARASEDAFPGRPRPPDVRKREPADAHRRTQERHRTC